MVRKDIPLVGGRLCLDFVNTVSWRGADEPRDNLGSYLDLLRFGTRTGAVSRAAVATLRRQASEDSRGAIRALERARMLREAIYRSVVAWRRGRAPSQSDLALVNKAAPARDELLWERGRFAWAHTAKARPAPLESVLWPIVWSLLDLVTNGEGKRVGTCSSAACGWLFYDESRSQKRRWCSMSDCGNRAKARRHYERAARSAKA